MAQLIGTIFNDRYQITRLLGRQTGRRTFLATDLQTQTAVVIKLLLFGPDFEWNDLKLFEREAAVLQSLDHPSIPAYLDYFEVETTLGKGSALVQNYLAAQSLQAWIESGRTFSEADLKSIAKDLLNILQYLHTRNPIVIHRDLKPSNILLGDRSAHSPGEVCLVDFGSVQTAIQGGTRTIVGTYGYMPPEQFGGQTSAASDLYALGATLIFLATGKHPDQLPQRNLRIEFEPQSHLTPSFIDYLKALTAPSLADRFTSAQEALLALENLALNPTIISHNSASIIQQPVGSKVKITQTDETFEFFIPPRGFHPELIFLIGWAIAWDSFLIVWYGISLATGNLFMGIFAILHLIVGIGVTGGILFTLFGSTHIRMNASQISQSFRILGIPCLPTKKNHRSHISKLEYIGISYQKNSEGEQITIQPQINLWAGVQKFEIAKGDRFSPPEMDWIAAELSQWLDLSITKT